jgi:2-polyprenyl-3-methyl-5-hydroxy-6-metoxy-1,4-benzoquinol methylase
MQAGAGDEPPSTTGEDYTQRLVGASGWKRVLNVQAPYRWHLRRQRLGRTLDIGCGVGRNLVALDSGSVGVDHNETSVRVARERGLVALTVSEWEASELREPGSFDSLLVAHVIEHMSRDDAIAMLESYVPYLRSGGKAFLVCPQERGYASDATHVTWTDADDLQLIARRVGLEPVRATSFPLPRRAGRWFTYNEFCVLASKP